MADARIEAALEETTQALKDGLDITDLATLLRNAVEIAERLDDLTPGEKRELALEYLTEVIDKYWDKATPAMERAVEALDIPYLSDGMEAVLFDPIAKRLAPPLIKQVVMLALPSLVDLVINASKGGVQVNTKLWTKASAGIEFVSKHGASIEFLLKSLDGGGTSAEHALAADLKALRA